MTAAGQAQPGPAAQPAPAQQPQQAQAPAQAQPQQSQPTRSSSPARLRLARGLATAAALLTGIVATGTFDTNGVNATPNVIASQWISAERAGIAVAQADLDAARGVAATASGSEADREAFRTAYRDAAHDLSLSGSEGRQATAAGDLLDAGLLAERAVVEARTDSAAAAKTYAESSATARAATSASNEVAADAARNLNTGTRSGLVAIVGGLATLVLLGLLVWMALLTRRIVNVPLLVATAITGWLTYVSLNPSALPINYEQRVDEATASATAYEHVLQARQAQYAVALGLPGPLAVPLEQEMEEATRAVNALGGGQLSSAWDQASEGIDTLVSTEGTQARLKLIEQTQEAYDQSAAQLRERFTADVDKAEGGVGTTASITSGVALLLGLIAAAFAWAGITQRLRDYR